MSHIFLMINFKNYKDFLDLNDSSVVQFIHRNIAYLIVGVLVFIGFKIKKQNQKNYIDPIFI